MSEWFELPEEDIEWLVQGLITTDDCAAANGKPKSGKSTGIRNLIAAVVQGGKFLDREVCIPPDTGRVLYLHLDRKDRKHRVAKELRQLGITKDAASRIRLLTERDMPKDADFDTRCAWLAGEVKAFSPNLIVIDLLLHFVRTKKGVNDYDTMIDAVAQLQDSLSDADTKVLSSFPSMLEKHPAMMLATVFSARRESGEVSQPFCISITTAKRRFTPFNPTRPSGTMRSVSWTRPPSIGIPQQDVSHSERSTKT